MSTRGCVAKKNGEGWEGVYNHFDSYQLHQDVWNEIKARKAEGMTTKEAILDVIKLIEDNPQGFSAFPDSPYDKDRDGNMVITDKSPDPLFMEYVVILDPEAETMEVLGNKIAHAESVPEFDRTSGIRMLKHNRRYKYVGYLWYYGHCVCWHRHLLTVDLNADELPSLREPEYRELKTFPVTAEKFVDMENPPKSRTRMDMLVGAGVVMTEVLETH